MRAPSGPQTRPSSERLRQAIFNVLRHYRWDDAPILEGATIVDLFAGSGALGLEAVSNGANQAWLVDSHPAALKALEANIETVARSFQAQELECPLLKTIGRDILAAYPTLPQARVIFCDPPYEQGWLEKVRAVEERERRLAPGGLFIYEAREGEGVPPAGTDLRLFDTKIYGDSAVHFFIKTDVAAGLDGRR